MPERSNIGERELTDDCDDCERNDEFDWNEAPELFDALLAFVETREAFLEPYRDD